MIEYDKKDYEFIGYTFPEWGALKQAMNGQEYFGLPRMTVNGREYGQSAAALRMAGKMHGYYDPTDWKSSYYCDVIIDQWSDMLKCLDPFLGGGTDEEKMAGAMENIQKVHVACFKLMEAQLEALGTTYIAGNKLCIADFVMSAFVHNIYENPNGPLNGAVAETIESYPKVKAYFGRLKEEFKETVANRKYATNAM